jgi:hypothetical protein
MKTNGYDMPKESEQESAAYDMKQSARRDLAVGVLKQAAQDLLRFRGATSKIEREIYLEAHRWLTINECASPFSFLNVCHFLGLVPEQVRRGLIGDVSSDALSYWIRRCGRAARRFQISVGQLLVSERNASAAYSYEGVN